MTKSKKNLYAVGFVLLVCFNAFWVAGFLAAMFLIPDDAGLAGGAMVFMYGLGGLVLGLIGSIWVSMKWTEPRMKKAMYITLAVTAVTLISLVLRAMYMNAS